MNSLTPHCQEHFSYIEAVTFIGGGNRFVDIGGIDDHNYLNFPS